jgi:hypothetical protein
VTAEADLPLRTENGFFELEFQIDAEIISTLRTIASAPAAGSAEHPTEEVSKEIAEILEDNFFETAAAGAEAATVHAGVAEAVIPLALVGTGENAVSLGGFLEFFFRYGVARIAVRVILHRKLAISRLQLLLRAASLDTQNFVIIAFGLC